jgi:hypothetical protein
MLGVLTVSEEPYGRPMAEKTRWYYSLADGIVPNALKTSPVVLPPTPDPVEDVTPLTSSERSEETSEETSETTLRRGSNTSGEVPPQASDEDGDQWWVDSPTAPTEDNPPDTAHCRLTVGMRACSTTGVCQRPGHCLARS